jgi:capsular polysaccharide transport system ATP-binding protein
MIEFRDVSKHYLTQRGRKTIVDRLDLALPDGAKVGLLGRNGAGKTTLLAMVAGVAPPNSGSIRREGAISWPLGFGWAFHPELTGAQNVRFVARIYGVDTDALVAYAAAFAEIGEFIDMPVRSYSSGMKARLGFGMAMGIAFDWYLVDEITAVGDSRFKKKSLAVFRNRLRDAGLLMVSHSVRTLRDYCEAGIVLEGGRARYYPDIEEAIAVHEANLEAAA